MATTTKPIIKNKGGLIALFGDMKESIQEEMGKGVDAKQVLRAMQIAASRQPKLLECTRESFAKAIMDSTRLSLDCSGVLGEGYLVPFFNGKIGRYEALFIPGYQGLIKLCLKSGQIKAIEARVVYEKDEFAYEYGLEPKLIHRPPSSPAHRGGVTHAYAVARFADGSKGFEVMDIHELNAIRARHRSRDKQGNEFGPWKTDTNEMYRKCPVRRAVKYWPRSEDLMSLLEIDNRQYGEEDVHSEPIDVTPKSDAKQGKGGVKALEEQLEKTADGLLFNKETGEVVETEEDEDQHKIDMINACTDLFQTLNPQGAKKKLTEYLQVNFGLTSINEMNLDQLRKLHEDLQMESAL